MKKFLLLRSNKQSGPYSAEELKQMGLKAYDLIWVEGKSAAWRYPGEVEDLKAFAPAVEEQPFDRFYKKPSETESASAPLETSAVAQPAAQQQQQPVMQPQQPPAAPPQQQPVEKPARKEKEYKRVFVTLPSNAAAKPQAAKPATETSSHIQFQPPAQQQPVTETKKPEVKTQPIIADDESEKELYERKVAAAKAASVKNGFSKPANIEGETDIYYPKKRSRFKGVPLAAMIIGMIAMVAVGILIGMSLDGNKGVSLIRKVDPVTPANNQTAVPKEPQPRDNNTALNQTAAQVVVQDSIETTEVKKPVKTATVHKKNNTATDTNQQDMAANLPVNEEPKITQEEVPVKKELPKPATPDLEKMVSVSNNDYEVGPFGGISKLALTVTNSSEYALSLVVVQLEYLKANKEVYKTENLYFRDVAANSTLTVDAPRSSRGNKINYKIKLINSKDHIYHAGN